MGKRRTNRVRSSRTAFRLASIPVLVVLVSAGCGRRAQEAQTAGPAAQESTATQPTPPPGRPLPDSAFRVNWGKHNVPSTLAAGATVRVNITVRNDSDTTWPDPRTADASETGAYAVRLSYRWLHETDDTPAQDDQSRLDLPAPLAPGESVTLTVPVTVPGRTGRYRLQFDLVQELVAWFEAKGAARLIVPVTVQ
jgi:hypothetical protein